MTVRVLFVCLGNICRSPTAEAVFRDRLRRAGLDELVDVDSAGTGDWHVGKSPDARARAAAESRGYDMGGMRARQVCEEDFRDFNYMLAMDADNLRDLRAMSPVDAGVEPELFLRWHPEEAVDEVPDPYYGGDQGFAYVLDLVEAASDALVAELRRQHRL